MLWALFALAWGALLVLAMAARVNHDESQYLAAAALTRHARPFVDFLYLQTPLQPWVFAPIVGIAPGWSFVVLRLVTASLGAALLAATYAGARAAGAPVQAAVKATALLACCQTFPFSTTVVRNDALAGLLAALAMLALLRALGAPRRATWSAFAAGLALGLAVSTKISYAIPLAGAGLFLLFSPSARDRGRVRWPIVAAFVCGGALGGTPTLATWAAAPEAFTYGVFDYGAAAPFRWYAANGLAWRLSLGGKLLDSLVILALGPALLALLLVARDRIGRGRVHDPRRLLLEWLIVAGLIAALLPTPTWRQYFLPLEAPLFARFALVRRPCRRWLRSLFVLSAAAGLASNLVMLGDAVTSGRWPVLAATGEAHWIGAALRHAPPGVIATLSPQRTIDSGRPLDLRFATGPFGYRTADPIDDARQRRLALVSPRTLAAALDQRPPAAIVTGYEEHDNLDRLGLDDPLRRYAERRGYAPIRSPFGRATLWVAPPSPASPRASRR